VRWGSLGKGQHSAALLLILATTALRLAFGTALGLGVDESYMVASGRVLSLGYYDHPPAAWWLSWAAAYLFGSEAPIVVRLPFIAQFALSTWLMYRLGTAIAGARAGLWAAVLLNLSPVFGVTTGTWVLPDGPLDCALLGAALCLVRALERGTLAWWLAAGLCAGLALLSKYSAALTIAGAGVYLLTNRTHRRWLAKPQPWLAALVAVALFTPVLIWNAAHGWASFAFQAARATGTQFRPLAPLLTLAGEALFVLPWIWAPMMAVSVAVLRRGPSEWRPWLLCCLAAPPIVAFTLVAAWTSQRILYHWAAPGYLLLFPLLGNAVASCLQRPAVRRTLLGTAALVILATVVIATQVRFDWVHPAISALTRKDPDIEAVDWTSLRNDVPQSGVIVGVPDWRDAGKIAYALGPHVIVLCLNRDGRQFGIAWPPARFIGADMLILAPEHGDRVIAGLGPAFDTIEPRPAVSVHHAGRTLLTVAVFQAKGLRNWPPP
jgi:4-amino-4-deoxy-L-arabinose transferase-like glycosyltransferase